MNETTVIICSYNGANKIAPLLDALSKQSTHDFKVLIMLDGSTDRTAQVVEDFRHKFTPSQLKVEWQENQGRARVKNNAASIAPKGLLIFFDDDTEPAPDTVQKHIDFHRQFVGVVAGNVLEIQDRMKTDVANYKASLTTQWTEKYPSGISTLDERNLFFSAANCSVMKSTFEQLNGFDSLLRDAEDFDFALRALDNGVPVYFDKSNIVIHHENITCAGYIKRLRQYAEAHEHLRNRYPERKAVIRKSSSTKRMIYRLFSFSFWPNLIDSGVFVFLLPKKIRYRLYAIVIQALSVEYANVAI